MSGKVINNLGKGKLKQLLAAIGSKPDLSQQPQYLEYDWTKPHCFSAAQYAALQQFAQTVAENVADKFSVLCQNTCNVNATSIDEQFVPDMIKQTDPEDQKGYYLGFVGAQERLCGFINIPLPTAIVWSSQLLGDSEAASNSSRQLSKLEESLLSDAAFTFIKSFSDSFDNSDFHAINKISRDIPELPFQNSDELCRITFETKKENTEEISLVYLTILSQELASVATSEDQKQDRVTSDDPSKAIFNYLLDIPIVVTSVLATTNISLEQAMSLKQGDILVLDKNLDEPAELIVNGKTTFWGWLAQSTNKYALVVADIEPDEED